MAMWQKIVSFDPVAYAKKKLEEKTGETLLLSADGIKRRFSQTPYTERKQTKDIFNWLRKFR